LRQNGYILSGSATSKETSVLAVHNAKTLAKKKVKKQKKGRTSRVIYGARIRGSDERGWHILGRDDDRGYRKRGPNRVIRTRPEEGTACLKKRSMRKNRWKSNEGAEKRPKQYHADARSSGRGGNNTARAESAAGSRLFDPYVQHAEKRKPSNRSGRNVTTKAHRR